MAIDTGFMIKATYPNGCVTHQQCDALDSAADVLLKGLLENGQDEITVSRQALLQTVWNAIGAFSTSGNHIPVY